MAIAKIAKTSNTVWTRPAVINAAVGAGLGLLALIFLWLAFQRYMVRSNYLDAVLKQDANRTQEVRPSAEQAFSWGNHPEARELSAKAAVDANQLDAAEKIYAEIAAGNRRAIGACGLGVVLIRRADGEKDSKKAQDLIKRAKDRFSEAKAAEANLFEAQIGSATADLILGVRTADPKKIASARVEFQRINRALRASEETARLVTREGYMDLFCGLARSNASPDRFSPEALAFAGSARRYLPGSIGLQANELSLQAQQMAEKPPTPAEMKQAKLYEKLADLKNRISAMQKQMEPLIDPWVSLTLAATEALHRAGDSAGSREMLNLVLDNPRVRDPLIPAVLKAILALETARAPEPNWSKRAANYGVAYGEITRVTQRAELQEPSRAVLAAALLNNQAFLEEDMGATGGGEAYYDRAVKTLLKALEAEQKAGIAGGSYEVRRNLAVIQKRRNKADAEEHLKAAENAAATRSEDGVRRDLEELRRYFEGKP